MAGTAGRVSPHPAAGDVLCRAILRESGRAWLAGTPSPELASLCARLASPDRLVALADEQGMVPILLDGVRTAGAGGLADALRERASGLARRNLQMAGELVRLLDALEAAGVRALSYKGPVLALAAYGDLGMRRFSDLDVLVHPADVAAASAVLEACGYAGGYAFTPAEARAFERLDGDYPFVHHGTGILVELHCRVASTRFVVDLPTEALWAESVDMELAGRPVRTLSPRHGALVAAVHGAKHRWKRLEWLVSFAVLARAADAAALMDAAGRARAERDLLLALALAERVLGQEVPAALGARVAADAVVARLAGQVDSELRLGGGDDAADANLRFNLLLRRGVVERLRYVGGWLAPTPEDWRAVPLPAGLHGLHRVLRPARLAWRYLPRVWRRGRRPAPD
jgi:hypothetical protein